MPSPKNEPFIKRVVYDFSVHAGAVGAITLDSQLPDGLIIQRVTANVQKAVVGGSGATIALGNQTTATAYLAATGKASFTPADAVVGATLVAAPVKIRKAASTDQVVMTIGTAALTDGVIEFYIEGIIPADQNATDAKTLNP